MGDLIVMFLRPLVLGRRGSPEAFIGLEDAGRNGGGCLAAGALAFAAVAGFAGLESGLAAALAEGFAVGLGAGFLAAAARGFPALFVGRVTVPDFAALFFLATGASRAMNSDQTQVL